LGRRDARTTIIRKPGGEPEFIPLFRVFQANGMNSVLRKAAAATTVLVFWARKLAPR